eukprot:GGOE01046714.1.p1 GENE.GGOE01046714.1~~GGOE01046714.1.p1  ORF type:complete len:460 (+),score=73.71 GGOE01046714.1:128-1381(+)
MTTEVASLAPVVYYHRPVHDGTDGTLLQFVHNPNTIPLIFVMVEWGSKASKSFNKRWNNESGNNCPTYQRLTSLQARSLNDEVILIEGGTECKAACNEDGIHHHEFNATEKADITKFVKKHWREPRDIRKARPHNYLWAYVRFWMLQSVVHLYKIERFVFADSDVMVYRPTRWLSDQFSSYQIAGCIDWPMGNHIVTLFTLDSLDDFLNFTAAAFPLGTRTDMHTLFSYAAYTIPDNNIRCDVHRRSRKPGKCICNAQPRCQKPPSRPVIGPKFAMGNVCRPWNGSIVTENMNDIHSKAFAVHPFIADDKSSFRKVTWGEDCLPYVTYHNHNLQLYAAHFQAGAKSVIGDYMMDVSAFQENRQCPRCPCDAKPCKGCGLLPVFCRAHLTLALCQSHILVRKAKNPSHKDPINASVEF